MIARKIGLFLAIAACVTLALVGIDYFAQRSHERGAQVVTSERRPGCDIKGNIDRTGERIYHVPGGQYYRSIAIETSKGERWFCNEAEARDAGWWRSKR